MTIDLGRTNWPKHDADQAAAEARFGKGRVEFAMKAPGSPLSRRQPICAHCGKRYGSRAYKRETITLGMSDDRPPHYQGNLILLDERWSVGPSSGPNNGPGARIERVLWDGESYHSGYDPFCTQRCGVAFAQAAHRAGYRIKPS